mgnify:CR=1 FL=1
MPTLVLRRGHVNRRENMATAEYRRGHGTRHCEKVIGPGYVSALQQQRADARRSPCLLQPHLLGRGEGIVLGLLGDFMFIVPLAQARQAGRRLPSLAARAQSTDKYRQGQRPLPIFHDEKPLSGAKIGRDVVQ